MRHIFYFFFYISAFFIYSLIASNPSTKLFAQTNSDNKLSVSELHSPRAGEYLESFSFRSLRNESISWDEKTKSLKINDSALNPTALIIHVFQPDCGKCNSLAASLQKFSAQFSKSDVFVIGVAHRKKLAASQAFAKRHSLTYPIVNATDTEWGRHWGRGDAFYIIDSSGLVVFAQIGFKSSDPESWGYVIEDLIGKRPNLITEAKRKRFQVGDTLPSIALPSIADGSPISLAFADNKLSLSMLGAKKRNYRASIGFFSRF